MAWVQDGYVTNLEQGDISGLLGNVAEGIGREFLGVDDLMRAFKKAKKGDFTGMLKSLGAGALELGTTVIPGGKVLKAAKLGKAFKGNKAASGLLRGAGVLNKAGMVNKSMIPALRGFRAVDIGKQVGAPLVSLKQGMDRDALNSALVSRQNQALAQLLSQAAPQSQALSYLSNYGGM